MPFFFDGWRCRGHCQNPHGVEELPRQPGAFRVPHLKAVEGRTDIFRSLKDAPPRQEEKPVLVAEENLRILQLDHDHVEERHRSIDSSVSASCEVEFPDWPNDGIRSAFLTWRQL